MKKIVGEVVKEIDQFPLISEEISLIAELGFMAATAGFVVPAIRIFQGLLVLRPNHAFSFVGLAVARLYVGAFADAIRVLREAIGIACYNRDEIELYLGFALHLADQSAEGARVLSALLERGGLDADQRPFAESVLGQIQGSKQNFAWPSPARVIDIQDFASSSH